jgi:hypothetical protein
VYATLQRFDVGLTAGHYFDIDVPVAGLKASPAITFISLSAVLRLDPAWF